MSTAVYSQSYGADTLRQGALGTSNGSRSHSQMQAVMQQEPQHIEQPMEEQYGGLFCRALYDYEAQDPSALSFRTDDIIEVLTQQPSGWWDGLLGEERGWFPSNYVIIISDEEADAAFSAAESTAVDGGATETHQVNGTDTGSHAPGSNSQSDNEEWLENERYRHGIQDSHRVRKTNGSQPSDFWIPEVTMDGQIYYVNTQTGQRSRDLPQEAEDEVSDSDLAGLTSQGTSRSGTSAGLAFGPSDVESGPEDAPISARKNGAQEKWVKHLADDGVSHYYQNSLDGRIQWTAPEEPAKSVGRDAAFTSAASRPPDMSRLSVYSDDSDIQPFDHLQSSRPRKQNGAAHMQQASNATRQATAFEFTQAEQAAKALQAALEPAPPVGISDLSTAATNAIQTVVDNVRSNARVPSSGHGDQQMDQLIHNTVLAARNLLYAAAAPTTQIPSSVIPGGKKGGVTPTTSSQSPLKPAQRKVTATLSRLVLSARAIQYDSGSQLADTLNRIETDSEELGRAVAAFVNEVERHELEAPKAENKSKKRLQGVFSTENLGMGLMGGGAAGSWKAFGFIPLGDEANLPKKVLGAEVASGVSMSLERIQDGLSNLQQLLKLTTENSVTQIRTSVQELVTRISSFLSLVADIHIARHVDVDGMHSDGDAITNPRYLDSLDKARRLVRKLEAVVQTVYDDSSSLFMAAQALRDNDRGLDRMEPGSAFGTLDSLVFTLHTNLDLIKQTLEGLLAVGHEQADVGSGEYTGSLEWRMSRFSMVNEQLKELSGTSDEDEYHNRDVVDMLGVLTKPTVKKQKSATEQSFDSHLTLANDTSSLPTRDSEFSLDRTLVTPTTSTDYRDNFDDDEEDLPKPNRPAGGSKLTRLLGDEYADKMAIDLQPWYLRPNYSPSDIIIEADGSVKGGTVAALVEKLTAHEQAADTTFNKAFLMTYKSFTTLDELFDLLVARFRIQPPDNLTPAEREEWGKLKQHVIQIRVINTMKSMVTDDGVLEKEDMFILDRMKEFISSDEVSRLGAAKHLMIQIERLQSQGGEMKAMTLTNQGAPPPPIVPKSKKLKLLDIDATELARQLTILESNLYREIKPMECLQRSREQKTENVDNIAAVIQTSNRIACWVAESVLSREDSRRRAQVVKYLITVADRCRVLNNFSTMIAITSGLNTPPIRRLKRTWEQVNQRFMAQFNACEMTIDSNKNFTKYRTLMASVTPPCVPFIGVFLSTLTFIQDGNSDNLPGGLVNFRKRQMASEVINDIKRWQAQPFNFQSVSNIQTYITESLGVYTDTRASSDHFWALSLEREPREREDEKMARLLQESGFL